MDRDNEEAQGRVMSGRWSAITLVNPRITIGSNPSMCVLISRAALSMMLSIERDIRSNVSGAKLFRHPFYP